jgi:hypothetical protein
LSNNCSLFLFLTGIFIFSICNLYCFIRNHHWALFRKIFELLWNKLIWSFNLLCIIEIQVFILEYLIFIWMLNKSERAHLYLIDTWLRRNNSIHFKLGLPGEIAWSFDFKITHFNIDILTSLSFTLNVKCYAIILNSFSFHVKICCFKIKYTPLAVLF